MEIYVVQQGDTIYTIAEKYGISADKLVEDNGLIYPYDLVNGQSLIITFPKQTHIVQEGETLQSIADFYNVTQMQIIRNNPNHAAMDYLNPGETLVISYNTSKSITINGFAYPYIKKDILIRTLPNLTYLSVFNYTITERGEIITYYDDSEIIQTAREYHVIPLLMLTALTPLGLPNIEAVYNILLNDAYQERVIDESINIMKNQGYMGINFVFNFLNENNQSLYLNFAQKVSNRLRQEGLLFYVTINYSEQETDNKITVEQINYSSLSDYVNGLIFLKFVWGYNDNPPAPLSNINNIRILIDNVASGVSSDKIVIGKPVIGYDWQLPYIPNRTVAFSLTVTSALELAYNVGASIQFDEVSQTPYFYYNEVIYGYPSQHIVWFIDARSIDALNQIIIEYDLYGSGVWNIMVYYQQLWTAINSRFDVIKLI
ncbi:LysM peptidoglycan-binding domain-containing protein [Anaerocolumna sedimenticola]|uniref:LysM peptidoglycan-binding domain-containing protein n=1 Tax=Anaerocolumna sedimenticola TaxID=2696063 RepID=A0A6P1TQ28_9FIRM|nr:LysM peptidoglycan-binding domain-containing protein [Anaerocolumna sedimenticola]QHQ63350.1 LysM peptidoglycan-binding domain-containing protein [Anaerocolumna sedimenticola]